MLLEDVDAVSHERLKGVDELDRADTASPP